MRSNPANPHQWSLVGNVLLSRSQPGTMPDASWTPYVQAIHDHQPRYCLMLCSGTVEVDAAQRRRFTQAIIGVTVSAVVLTDDRVTRGWAMSVAWFGADVEVHSWRDLPQVVDALRVDGPTRSRLHDEALRFFATLSAPAR